MATSIPSHNVAEVIDATLELIAEHKPASEAALKRINGVGPSKIERYGEAVLALVAEYP